MDVVRIGDRDIGGDAPVYIIAEAGSNHDRNLDQAKRLIDVAAEAGADAVKFQTFTADRIVAETKTRAKYLDGLLPPDKTMSDLFRDLELPREWHATLFEHATAAGLDFLSTPFDHEAVDLLDGLGVKAFKVASYELWHLPLIRDVASRGKPIICSTGMADMADVQEAVDTVAATGNDQLILLHCVVKLPAAVQRPQPPRNRDDASRVSGARRLQRSQRRDHSADRCDRPRRGRHREALHAEPRPARAGSSLCDRAARAQCDGPRDSRRPGRARVRHQAHGARGGGPVP